MRDGQAACHRSAPVLKGVHIEIVLTSEPDSTFFLRLQNIPLASFVPRINCSDR
jgi:hypothetical protein